MSCCATFGPSESDTRRQTEDERRMPSLVIRRSSSVLSLTPARQCQRQRGQQRRAKDSFGEDLACLPVDLPRDRRIIDPFLTGVKVARPARSQCHAGQLIGLKHTYRAEREWAK